jgi:hypothetical protein
LVVAAGCGLFRVVGLGAGGECAARSAEGSREKAKHNKRGTEAREDVVIASAHLYIVRGVGREGIAFRKFVAG